LEVGLLRQSSFKETHQQEKLLGETGGKRNRKEEGDIKVHLTVVSALVEK